MTFSKSWIFSFFLLCLSPSLLVAQRSMQYSVHAGLGTSWAKINTLQTDWYYYATLPKGIYDLGLKMNYPLVPWLSAMADVSIGRSAFQARRMEEAVIDTNNITGIRREYWSDFSFYNTTLELGLEIHPGKKFSLGISCQGIYNFIIREARQERWLAFPVYESKVLGTDRRSGSPYFERFDLGINTFVSHRINQDWGISFDFYYTRHSVANRAKGNWLENRSLKFNIHHFIN